MRSQWYLLIVVCAFFLLGASECDSQEKRDQRNVNDQQAAYAKFQPVPTFDFSLERHLVSELYKVRNQEVSTHAVWRSDYGTIEGDCPSMGYGLPYDTSLTNPLKNTYYSGAVVEQAEPNGIFASKNTSATWVMCVRGAGLITPVYVESKVTIYPGFVKVNYETNRVYMTGKANVSIKTK